MVTLSIFGLTICNGRYILYLQKEIRGKELGDDKLATISDVARLSGLSVSTVSRVINNKPHVSEDKKRRVQEAMDALGYSPLQAARQMRGSGSGNIAVAVPTIMNNFFACLVDSIERTCRTYNYRTLITQTYGAKDREEEAMELVRMHHADGIILCAIENDWKKLKNYGQYGKVVACNEYNDDRDVSMIYGKQYEGFYEASEYLIQKGHRKIAYCTGSHALSIQPQGINIDSDRYRGYVEAMSNNQLVANPNWLFSGIGTLEDGRKVMHQILELKDRPDAVIAGSDEVAAGMMMETLACGVHVPKDIAIMGVDDQPIASLIQVPLTTIRQPIREEGEYAAKEMVRQLTAEAEETVRKELELELVIRQSA